MAEHLAGLEAAAAVIRIRLAALAKTAPMSPSALAVLRNPPEIDPQTNSPMWHFAQRQAAAFTDWRKRLEHDPHAVPHLIEEETKPAVAKAA